MRERERDAVFWTLAWSWKGWIVACEDGNWFGGVCGELYIYAELYRGPLG
jgi:hypothetical protein